MAVFWFLLNEIEWINKPTNKPFSIVLVWNIDIAQGEN